MNKKDKKCVVCNKEINDGDIFTQIKIDMRRLTYDKSKDEKDFLVPDGPVSSFAKFELCENCSKGIMTFAIKDVAVSIVNTIKKNQ